MDWKKVDGEVQFFSPVEGRNRINIIPYVIKSKNHPLVKKGEFEIGDKDYVMDVYVHRGVGPSEASVLCLKNTYGKPCPICEQSQVLRKQGKEEEAGALKASRRVFYNVQDLKNPDTLKVFEASHYLFEKELIDEARDDDEGGFVDFADEETGKEIKFRCSKVTKGKLEFNEFKSFSFEDRDENIPDELLENAISFDEILRVPTYDEVEKILYGRDDDDDEEDDDEENETATKTAKKKLVVNEDDEEVEEEVEKPASKKSVKKNRDDDDDDDDDDEEVPAKPATKSKAVEDNDDDNDDEDETPVKKPSKKEKDCGGDCSKCPFGHKFGEDTDEFDDCDDCDVWDKCINGK
ncbi:hypothetical protein [Methanobrevibacter sp.]|uniref:hypothetical protein n=1 Tax=Methanobrevibacter sp. TaxID=66852 RepID=UPI00386A5457